MLVSIAILHACSCVTWLSPFNPAAPDAQILFPALTLPAGLKVVAAVVTEVWVGVAERSKYWGCLAGQADSVESHESVVSCRSRTLNRLLRVLIAKFLISFEHESREW